MFCFINLFHYYSPGDENRAKNKWKDLDAEKEDNEEKEKEQENGAVISGSSKRPPKDANYGAWLKAWHPVLIRYDMFFIFLVIFEEHSFYLLIQLVCAQSGL